MKNRKSDNLATGIGGGVLIPVVTFAVLLLMVHQLIDMGILTNRENGGGFRLRTLSLLSIAANLILVRYFRNRRAYRAVRGVSAATLLLAVVWIFYFAKELL